MTEDEPGLRDEGQVATAGGAAAVNPPDKQPGLGRSWWSLAYLLPALFLLSVVVLYPILYTTVRSMFDAQGDSFVGLENYTDMFTDPATLISIRNNAIWVVVAPIIVTTLGLIFAVLTERIRWASVFKLLVFMPMAISFVAAGIIFRLVYQADPDQGVANALIVSVHDIFAESSAYPGAGPRDESVLSPADGGFETSDTFGTGDAVAIGLVGFAPNDVDPAAQPASEPAGGDTLSGVVWLDFAQGGGGEQGMIDNDELGLPDVQVQAIQDGTVIATTETQADGSFQFAELADGSYTLALPRDNFREPFNGLDWLGPALITPAIIGAYVWIWAGFAMVLIAAGLAAIPRDALEAARVDGATETQVFRRVTMPLLAPVLLVVLVTLVINVLKVFDLVYIIAPGSVQDDANVLALQMYRVSFGGADDQGLGSALSVLLFLLVLPAMAFNIRRFRREQS
ncbi:MAG: ABC transporter permease subunit [Actinomycetota bacterium]|nr:ABC transporter permease subunit [Actinomycetota bacterium]